MRIITFAAVFAAWAVCSAAAPAAMMPDSATMRREADAFLAGLPAGLQQRQTEAVEAAIGGDCTLLADVRNARNSAPQYSDGVEVRELTIPGKDGRGICARLYSPADGTGALPLLIYFHGGGWTFGSLNSCARFCDAVAATGCAKVLAVDYALAPEHPFPEGLDDCLDAVDYAFGNSGLLGIDSAAISVGGDSSGGNLALSTALAMSDGDARRLKSVVAFYPVVRAENDGSESWRKYGESYGLDAALMEAFNRAYGGTPTGSLVSPAYASDEALRRLPPLLIINAGRDILASQGRQFADRVSRVGGTVKHMEYPGAVHLFITVPGQDAAFAGSVEAVKNFCLQR